MQTTPSIPADWSPSRLILIGGSVRAAAMSAVSAGFRVMAIDRFGDQDLREVCDSWQRWRGDSTACGSEITAQLAEMTAQTPDQPTGIVLTGGGEGILSPNGFPDLPGERNLRWLTASASAIRNSAAPTSLEAIAATAGIRFPEWKPLSQIGPLPLRFEQKSPGQWLFKPFVGCGGLKVQAVDVQAVAKRRPPDLVDGFLQKRITGVLFGASYVASPQGTTCLGVSRGLASKRAPHPFRYGGSVGPLRLSQDDQHQIDRLGSVAADQLGLRGLFGIDFLISGDDWYLLEINPRFCASMELYDDDPYSPIAAHVAAFTQPSPQSPSATFPGPYRGKHIVYAEKKYLWDQTTAKTLARFLRERPALSVHDVPTPGTSIAESDPLFTISTSGATAREALRRAFEYDRQWQRS